MLKKTMVTGLAILVFAAAFPVWGQIKPPSGLKGMDIIIGNWWADYDVNTRKPKNDLEEEQIAQRKKLMQENGLTIREKAITDWNGMQQKAVISTMSGKPDAHIFLLEPRWAMAMRARGLLAPLSDSKVVNIKNPQSVGKGYEPVPFNQSVIDSFTFDGKAYAFSVGINLNNFQALFFNKRLFREAGLDPNLPYDMQKAGTWTWAAFLDVCKKLTRDKNNDGIMDTYAMCADLSTEILDAILSSNGATYVDKDPKTGKFVNATNRPEFLEALQFAIRLKNEGVLKVRPDGSNWDWYKSEFIDGRVAMRIDESYIAIGDAVELGKMKDDWGMVLFPKGPKSQTYRVYIRDNLMVIPATYKQADIDKILFAVSLWQTPVKTDWKSGQYNYFRDPRAVDETLALVRDPKLSMIKYFSYINGLERGDIAWQMWWHEGEPAQLIEAVSQDWNAKIAEANK
ncbi:MAG: extracellular solute-binding protein [Treponema sp.]|jgi:ABC-type glycerol-3-phosphate transport system substrate-binding protein|nr:extracellular solute-binding protein [Treponema sp.]